MVQLSVDICEVLDMEFCSLENQAGKLMFCHILFHIMVICICEVWYSSICLPLAHVVDAVWDSSICFIVVSQSASSIHHKKYDNFTCHTLCHATVKNVFLKIIFTEYGNSCFCDNGVTALSFLRRSMFSLKLQDLQLKHPMVCHNVLFYQVSHAWSYPVS